MTTDPLDGEIVGRTRQPSTLLGIQAVRCERMNSLKRSQAHIGYLNRL